MKMVNKEAIEKWFNKAGISIFSLYVCTLLVIDANEMENTYNNINNVSYTILSQLLRDGRITEDQKKLFRHEISNNNTIRNHFKDIIIDIINNNPLSDKDDITNKCFPCRKYKLKINKK